MAGQSPLGPKDKIVDFPQEWSAKFEPIWLRISMWPLDKIRHRASGTRGVFIGFWLSLAQFVCPGQFAWVGLYCGITEQSCSGNLSTSTHFARSAFTARSRFFSNIFSLIYCIICCRFFNLFWMHCEIHFRRFFCSFFFVNLWSKCMSSN